MQRRQQREQAKQAATTIAPAGSIQLPPVNKQGARITQHNNAHQTTRKEINVDAKQRKDNIVTTI